MLMRLLLLISLALLLFGCASSPPVQGDLPIVVNPIEQVRALSPYNSVEVEGQINVSLHTGYAEPSVILHGDPRDLMQITTVIADNTLLINLGKGHPKFGAVTADIRTKILTSFTYHGAGVINGPRLNSSSLDLSITNPERTILAGNIFLNSLAVNGPGYTEIKGVRATNLHLKMNGKPKVQLIGVVGISNIELDGEGWFGLYWVKSDVLTVRAEGHTFIQLAGITNLLDVELWDYAHFNGRYIRGKRTFVKTHDRSLAEITTVARQHTLATDSSDIYFYKIPEMRADFMAYFGAVLDMRDWNRFFLKDYDEYNK